MEGPLPAHQPSPVAPVPAVDAEPKAGLLARTAQKTLAHVCIAVLLLFLALLAGSHASSWSWLQRTPKSAAVNGPSPLPAPQGRGNSRWAPATADPNDAVDLFFKQAGHFRCPQERYFTRKEVAVHKTANDLWVVIEGNVLDLSMFISQHPGGALLLEGAGGDDAAALFAQYHHPSSVSLFPSFCIGRIKKE